MTLINLKRGLQVLGYMVRSALTEPGRLVTLCRRFAAMLLDQEFDRTSPIPAAPNALVVGLGSHDIVLPPANLFQPGNQDTGGLLRLVSIAKAIDAKTVFEIGTYNGLTALTLAMNLPTATIHTLDLPRGQAPALPLFAHDHLNLNRFDGRVFDGRPEAERIVQHLGDSAEFDFVSLSRKCDLVYIDGAHSYEYVANDTTRAFEIVSGNGVVVWDDYWRRVPDVMRFLRTHRRDNMYRLPGSRLVAWFSDRALARACR